MPNWIPNLPEQVRRLALLVVVVVIAFLIVRPMLIPAGFGEQGHFRSGALNDAVAHDYKYAGKASCEECHDDMTSMLASGYHNNLSCEVCHGPLAGHVEEPEEVQPEFPRGRNFCPVCHEYLSARPTGFPQIVSQSHNQLKACINCHEPHDPVPSEVPEKCSACHGKIARSKAVSHHANVECDFCHSVNEGHKTSPREFRAAKPIDRNFCGQCHADSENGSDAPQIDLSSHEPRYVCWQCHYPHLPEAK
ncbi:hypothetical protein HQ531_05510 [bacterium]|nr:hypothetical protein [bacterium]